MAEDLNYITKLLKKTIYGALIVLAIYISYTLSIFYMPFIIAFIISLMMEPIIRFFMKKTNFTRKASSIILFVIVFGIIIGLIAWGTVTLISESTNLLQTLNTYIEKASSQMQNLFNKLGTSNIKFSDNILELAQNSSKELLDKVSKWLTGFLTNLLNSLISGVSISVLASFSIKLFCSRESFFGV